MRSYRVSSLTYCADCGASIVFVRTAANKKLPCNSIRVDYVPDYEGSSRVFTDEGVYVDCYIVDSPGPGTEKGYIPHFWTCPARQKDPQTGSNKPEPRDPEPASSRQPEPEPADIKQGSADFVPLEDYEQVTFWPIVLPEPEPVKRHWWDDH